jgi:hypothetical protein
VTSSITATRHQFRTGIQTWTSPGGTNLQHYGYQWNGTGTLAWRKDLGQNVQEDFGYDLLDRLTSTRRNSETAVNVSYSDDGNILSRGDVGSYSYAGGKPHAVSTVSGARSGAYRYDANGNLICRGATAPSPCPAGQQLTWTPAGYP